MPVSVRYAGTIEIRSKPRTRKIGSLQRAERNVLPIASNVESANRSVLSISLFVRNW